MDSIIIASRGKGRTAAMLEDMQTIAYEKAVKDAEVVIKDMMTHYMPVFFISEIDRFVEEFNRRMTK